jgi:hypothetical protein
MAAVRQAGTISDNLRGHMPNFRIIDLRTDVVEPEQRVEARSPEQAAETALGIKLVRSGHARSLVCRVYWDDANNTNMVRLYSKVADHHA